MDSQSARIAFDNELATLRHDMDVVDMTLSALAGALEDLERLGAVEGQLELVEQFQGDVTRLSREIKDKLTDVWSDILPALDEADVTDGRRAFITALIRRYAHRT